jgi:hypothetical protein
MPLPDLSGAFSSFAEDTQFKVIKKEVVDFEVQETPGPALYVFGHMQPLHERQLLVKVEGERGWKYWRLFTTDELKLDWELVDEQLRRYRVMASEDWREANYFVYQVVEGDAP